MLSAKSFSFATLSCRNPEREGLNLGEVLPSRQRLPRRTGQNPRGVDLAKGQCNLTLLPSSTEERDFQIKQLQKFQSITLVFSFGRLNEWLLVPDDEARIGRGPKQIWLQDQLQMREG